MRRSVRSPGAVAVAVMLLAACGQIPQTPGSSTPGSPGVSPTATPDSGDQPASEVCEYTAGGTAARPVKLPTTTDVPDTGTSTVTLAMSDDMTVKFTLDRAKAPCTVHSFESLAEQGYFDKTRCHRLVDSSIFVLQCGDPTATGTGGPGYTFANETDGTESYKAGVVAMANAGPNTNGSQFFLVYEDSTRLDSSPDYTIFGKMDETSRGVVASIAYQGQDGSNPDGSGKPNNPAEIITAKITTGKAG